MAEKSLIVTPFPIKNIGGAETFAEDLAKALGQSGRNVHICTLKWEKPTLWQGLPLAKGLVMYLKLSKALRKMRKKYSYTRVYALGIIASAACYTQKIPYDSVMLALYDFKKKNMFTRFINASNRVFVEGYRGKDDMVSLGVSEYKIVLFNHWCDQSRFQWKERNNKRLKVLFVGRPIEIKGAHIIKQCEGLTKDIDYEYVTNVPYNKLHEYYQHSDVCVVPSLYSEGFTRVVSEAASCGCIVITSNKGALPELVKGWGKSIEPTPENFAKELSKLSGNPRLLKDWQLKTAWHAKKHFSVKNAEVFL